MDIKTTLPSREEIIETLKRLQKEGVDIFTPTALSKVIGPRFREQCRAVFGSWEMTLDAAGIVRPKEVEWTPDRVLDELKALNEQGIPLTTAAIFRAKGPIFGGTLVTYTARFWGGFHKAVASAGLQVQGDLEREERIVAEKRLGLLEKLRELNETGVNVSSKTELFRATGSHGIYLQARALFMDLKLAVEAAGLIHMPGMKKDKTWSGERVVKELQALAGRGLRMAPTIIEEHFAGLPEKARLYFGTFENACVEAGLKAEFLEGGRDAFWTREVIRDELRKAHANKMDMSVKGLGKDLYNAAGYVYGDITRALFDAGIYMDVSNAHSIGRAQSRVFIAAASAAFKEIYPSLQLRPIFREGEVKKRFDAYLPEENRYLDFDMLSSTRYSAAVARTVEAGANVTLISLENRGSKRGTSTESIFPYIQGLSDTYRAFFTDIFSYLAAEADTEVTEKAVYFREFNYLVESISSAAELKEELSKRPLLMQRIQKVLSLRKKLDMLTQTDSAPVEKKKKVKTVA